jgi:hypothetical protein
MFVREKNEKVALKHQIAELKDKLLKLCCSARDLTVDDVCLQLQGILQSAKATLSDEPVSTHVSFDDSESSFAPTPVINDIPMDNEAVYGSSVYDISSSLGDEVDSVSNGHQQLQFDDGVLLDVSTRDDAGRDIKCQMTYSPRVDDEMPVFFV